jgi:uncharacterized membrane protein YfcA
MGIETWLIGLGMVAIAGFTRGFSGFGSAMILAPSLSLLFNPQQVVATVILLEITAGAGLVPEAVTKIQWREVLPLVLGAIVMVPLGVYCLVLAEPNLIRRLMGGLILALVVVLNSSKLHYHQSYLFLSFGVGGLSGFLTGLAGIGGPPVVLYEMSGDNSAATNRANLIVFFAFTQCVALGVYWANDILTIKVFQLFAVFVPVFALGLMVGRLGFKRVNEKLFRRFVYGLLLVTGGLALVMPSN